MGKEIGGRTAAAPIRLDADGLVDLGVWTRSFDRLYRRTDQLYYEMARDCGIPESAYWVMYAIHVCGGEVTVRDLAREWCYSRQTVNSALRALEARGLVETSFCEGGRKAKRVTLSEEGARFVAEQIVPANKAERRAFGALSTSEQQEMLRLVRKYVEAVESELGSMGGGER